MRTRWNEAEIRQAELKDAFFMYIRYNKENDLDTLLIVLKKEVEEYALTSATVAMLLDGLVAAGKLIRGEGGQYTVHPDALYFTGFVIELLRDRKKLKKSNRKDMALKIIPITLAFLFGCSAIYFNLQNRKNEKEVERKTAEIGILQRQIKQLTVRDSANRRR